MIKFVILNMTRTGSTLLVRTLKSHPEITCEGEIFTLKGKMKPDINRFPFWIISFLPTKVLYVLNLPNVWMNLKGFLNNFYKENDDMKAKGFKLMITKTYYLPGMIQYLQKNNIKVIILLRENILKNALSVLRAEETDIWHFRDNSSLQVPKFHVNVGKLGKKMNRIIHFQKVLLHVTSSMDTLKIMYEDFKDWDNTISKVLKYLGVTDMSLPATGKKLNPDKLEDMVENYDEMVGWLKEKGYNHFL